MKYTLALYLLVILEPYKDIIYGEIDVYEYSNIPKVEIIESEASDEIEENQAKTTRYWCHACIPPQWLEF